jgi:O-antigen/teichoic acid export membrane protein
MARIRAYLVLVIILALAVHMLWDAIAPLVPYAVGGLVTVMVLGWLYFRRRW